MTRKLFLVGGLLVLTAIITACGSTALPEYVQAETSVAEAREGTQESLVAQGEIIPTSTPTEDFAATEAAVQATADFEATSNALAANAEATQTAIAEQEAAEAQAALDAQATVDAQATIDAQPVEPGADDPLFEAIQNADVANGELLFAANAVSPCTACHSIDPDVRLVGPSQHGVFARAVEGIENGTITADGPYTYLYDSIVAPNDYVVESYPPGVMPQNYGDLLSDDDIYDLVAYLATLGD